MQFRPLKRTFNPRCRTQSVIQYRESVPGAPYRCKPCVNAVKHTGGRCCLNNFYFDWPGLVPVVSSSSSSSGTYPCEACTYAARVYMAASGAGYPPIWAAALAPTYFPPRDSAPACYACYWGGACASPLLTADGCHLAFGLFIFFQPGGAPSCDGYEFGASIEPPFPDGVSYPRAILIVWPYTSWYVAAGVGYWDFGWRFDSTDISCNGGTFTWTGNTVPLDEYDIDCRNLKPAADTLTLASMSPYLDDCGWTLWYNHFDALNRIRVWYKDFTKGGCTGYCDPIYPPFDPPPGHADGSLTYWTRCGGGCPPGVVP